MEKSKTLELQKWIVANMEDWLTICGQGASHIDEQEFRRLWDKLEKDGFCELTYVLLTCHYDVIQKRVAENAMKIWELIRAEAIRRGIDPDSLGNK